MTHRLHVIGLPHTATTGAYHCCAYTGKIIRFCAMMKSLGHHVTLYGADENEAWCDELVVCTEPWAPEQYTDAPFNAAAPHWQAMNRAAIRAMQSRVEQRDYICLIAGTCQEPIADAFPCHTAVEFGIGYSGVCERTHKVWESYAWMHAVYGQAGADRADGRWYDAVIGNYFDPADFPLQTEKGDYLLYLGRLTARKGVQVAVDVAQRLGKRLVLAGPGDPSPYTGEHVEHVGVVGGARRAELLGRAQALLVPTLYLEPFGGVAVEAMLCGTPVITSDWGAFTEYVVDGVNGFRCRTLAEFCGAATVAPALDPVHIHTMAVKRFGMDNVRHQYDEYFGRLATLWGAGWYA